jgi:hypothetical protein
MLRGNKADEATVALLASGMENFVGVLGTVLGLDRPGELN